MSGFINRLKTALQKTSTKISNNIDYIFQKKILDNNTLSELEEILLFADIGYNVTQQIINTLKKNKFDKNISPEEIKSSMSAIITQILCAHHNDFQLKNTGLNVILMCGVNGNGKTTSIGKMAAQYVAQGKKVAIAACDTFRAAAVDQISEWATRSGTQIFHGSQKSDPASIAHQAVSESLQNDTDILLIDTAGRLHNQKNLMQELAKIIRVIKKIDQSLPNHILLTIDGTTGQNATVQVAQFKELVDISGLVITKLDGTAKAGTVIEIVQEFALPVYFIGIGEKIDDLRPFVPHEFAHALVN